MLSWEDRFTLEIENAYRARESGNEGRSRVCARRAAGVAAGEYLHHIGVTVSNQNSISNLRMLADMSEISQEMLAVISHFLVRVNTAYKLPFDFDLIQDAILLRESLISRRCQSTR